MEQSTPDIWSPLGTSLTIKSVFKLSLNEGHSPSINADPFSSRICGLGWIYNIQASNATSSSLASAERVKCTMFKIFFSAPHTATISPNKLSLAVKASDTGVATTTVHVTDISLPVPESIHLASILSTPNFTGNIHVHIVVRLELYGRPFEHAFRGLTPPNLHLHSVISRSLLSGELGDVTFGLFTRRGGNDVTDLDIIFADKSLVHGHNPFLVNLLSADNPERQEVKVGDLKAQAYNAYDYMSDSDLESDYDSDIDDLGDFNSRASSLSGEEVQSARRKLEDDEKVILIRDVAFATWKALVFYLYTKEIIFKPLTSSIASRNGEAREHYVACSPKSMYRLATKIESKELQLLSLTAIIRNLSEVNIVEELFSYFTSMYPEVQNAEVEALIPLLKQPTVVENLQNKMESVVTRGMPHCGAITAVIMRRVGAKLAVQG